MLNKSATTSAVFELLLAYQKCDEKIKPETERQLETEAQRYILGYIVLQALNLLRLHYILVLVTAPGMSTSPTIA